MLSVLTSVRIGYTCTNRNKNTPTRTETNCCQSDCLERKNRTTTEIVLFAETYLDPFNAATRFFKTLLPFLDPKQIYIIFFFNVIYSFYYLLFRITNNKTDSYMS